VLGLGLIIMHLYYDFASQGGRFRVVQQGALYYDFAVHGKMFRAV
jgi:hypothetical protein